MVYGLMKRTETLLSFMGLQMIRCKFYRKSSWFCWLRKCWTILGWWTIHEIFAKLAPPILHIYFYLENTASAKGSSNIFFSQSEKSAWYSGKLASNHAESHNTKKISLFVSSDHRPLMALRRKATTKGKNSKLMLELGIRHGSVSVLRILTAIMPISICQYPHLS